MSETSDRIQSTVPAYYRWVIKELVGMRGVSEADVGAYILKRWIDDKADELAKLGITPSMWREYREREGENVVNLPAHRNRRSKPADDRT